MSDIRRQGRVTRTRRRSSRRPRSSTTLRADLQAMLDRRLDVLLEEYGRAGCRTGRLQLGNAIDGAAESRRAAGDDAPPPTPVRARAGRRAVAEDDRADPRRRRLPRASLRHHAQGRSPDRALRRIRTHRSSSTCSTVRSCSSRSTISRSSMPGDPRKSYANAVGCEVSQAWRSAGSATRPRRPAASRRSSGRFQPCGTRRTRTTRWSRSSGPSGRTSAASFSGRTATTRSRARLRGRLRGRIREIRARALLGRRKFRATHARRGRSDAVTDAAVRIDPEDLAGSLAVPADPV